MSDETATSFQEGHAACPFVAFEDDRDHRADHPDYRHRCFAAAEPEPRALPHQERFCLSAAFAQCPIFLDWARQEAAGVLSKNAAAAAAAEAAAASIQPARSSSVETPAFLAGRGRTTPAEAGTVTPHASDPGSGLWGFEGAPKRAVAPLVPSAGSDASVTPAFAMARRQPTHPDWEKPPRLDNYPRLRAREDRNNNQPLLLAALGVAVLMVALILYPLVTGSHGVGIIGGGSTPTASGSFASGGPTDSVPTDTPIPTPAPDKTMQAYIVAHNPWDKTLTTIAAHFGVSLQLIELANPKSGWGSKSYDIIFPGMTIFIPWQTWTPPAPTPSPSPTTKATPTPLATPTPVVTPAAS